MTIRSEGQFNTVVYEDEDIYRGVDRRDVILMRPGIARLELRVDDRVVIRNAVGAARQRACAARHPSRQLRDVLPGGERRRAAEQRCARLEDAGVQERDRDGDAGRSASDGDARSIAESGAGVRGSNSPSTGATSEAC
ncbi:MAG: hypothetical protein U0575_06415 [Phycisphaerales bacterium]